MCFGGTRSNYWIGVKKNTDRRHNRIFRLTAPIDYAAAMGYKLKIGFVPDNEVSMNKTKFRMGRLDHVHIRVPDREVAARWYADYLGFEVVEKYAFWAKGFEGGPL